MPELASDPGRPGAHPAGLSDREAERRLRSEGRNELPRPERRSPLRIVATTLREPMFAMLLVASGIYLLLGDFEEASILAGFAVVTVSIAVIQEARAERVLEALRDLTSPRALVLRSGEPRRIPGHDVVRGDVLILGEGDRVAADAVLLEAQNVAADESLLSGESVPVRKIARSAGARHPDDEGTARVFAGSLIVSGQGLAEVNATGERSAIGKIGKALGQIDPRSPRMQEQTDRVVRIAGLAGLLVSGAVVVLFGLWRGSWLDAALSGIAVGMSMLPEEFPLVLTVFMAMGAWRISRAGVLTRRAAAIESLGAATVLCTDKTGTLTHNRMQIVELRAGEARWRAGGPDLPVGNLRRVVESGVLASAANPYDPMERAFHDLAAQDAAAHPAPQLGKELVRHFALTSELLAITQIWRHGESDQWIVASKGAPEAILRLTALSPSDRQGVQAQVEEMAGAGLRVLAVAASRIPAEAASPEVPSQLAPMEFLGLVGLADPLREEVPAAIARCRSAGVRIVMVTGDHPATAQAIARQAGLPADAVVSGSELAALNDAQLIERVRHAAVFARIMPDQKLRIVEALKSAGEIVAMTGDGVNDAPSLKAADIGIAMGGRGTDVAREASALVLLDDQFGSIVQAIALGRRIYDNLQKAVAYIIAIHVPIAGLALLPLIFDLPLLLLPLHIAFLEMVVDPVCSIVFEAEQEEPNIMRRPPRNPLAPFFSPLLVVLALAQGVVMLGLVASIYLGALRGGLPADQARALGFTALVATNIGLVLANRSFGSSLLKAILKPGGTFWAVLGATSLLLVAILVIPWARERFHFGAIGVQGALLAVGAAGAALVILESLKALLGRRVLSPTGRWSRPPAA